MKFSELKANWSWMLEHMPDDEPVVFPRRTAKKRMANKEKRKRIIVDTDETNYGIFHTNRERMLIGPFKENPTLWGHWLCEVMESWSDEMLERWVEAHEGKDAEGV